MLLQRLSGTADTSWSGNDFDLTGVLFEDAWFAGARFGGRHVWFDGAVFSGPNTSFEDVEFNAEVVSFDGASFESDATFAGSAFRARSASFGSAVFKCLRASFDAPAEWKNVEFDWDNPPSGSQQAVPRCITPRPWPPSLVAKESGTSSSPAAPEKDDDLAG